MRTFALLGIAAGIVCGASTLTTPASAAAYLSRTGSGDACSLAVPCNSMSTAIGVAGASGEVICLDKFNYGTAPILSSITISCGGGLWDVAAGAFTVQTPAGSSVVIEGLVSDSVGGAGTVINFAGQGALHLRSVRIGNNTTTFNSAIGFFPGGPAKLFVSDSYFYDVGFSGTASAIHVRPASGVTADVVIERTRIENNRFGIVANGANGGIIRGVVRDSIISGNVNNGITVTTAGSNVVLTVDNSTISGNGFGLVATGSNAGMLVRRSVINSNTTGLNTGSGGLLLSYGDNSVNGNNAGETFSGPVGLK